ncbi:MAG: thymidylate synthase [Proteobacteria bacterium]|nr:MAG: thymidylate synthase [Pseudomonadota bacterium]
MRTVTIPLIITTLVFSSLAWAEDDVAKEPLTATDKIVARFMELDTDLTEAVSFEEYMFMVLERTEARFALMDENKDGEVSADEYRQFWQAQKSQYYRLKR